MSFTNILDLVSVSNVTWQSVDVLSSKSVNWLPVVCNEQPMACSLREICRFHVLVANTYYTYINVSFRRNRGN